ncbi:hypothetical protein T4D_11192, partial [Trichinella pseudospiralis]
MNTYTTKGIHWFIGIVTIKLLLYYEKHHRTETFSKRRFNLYELMQLVKDTFSKIMNDVCSSSNSSWHVENSAHSCLHY